MRNRILSIILIACICFLTEGQTYADWTGPTAVMSSTLGDGSEQIYVDKSDIGEIVSDDFVVLDNGTVVINDSYIQLYNSEGYIRSIPVIGSREFSYGRIIYNNGYYLTSRSRGLGRITYYDLIQFNYDGNARWSKKFSDLLGHSIWYVFLNGDFLTVTGTEYHKYSSTGEYIRTYSSEEAALGKDVVDVNGIEVGDQYIIDNKGNVVTNLTESNNNVDSFSRVVKYDRCGKMLGSVDLPTSQTHNEPIEGSGGYLRTIYDAVYGEPNLYPDGSIYTTFRNETDFKILKWAWVDSPDDPKGGPDMPDEAQALPSNSGIYLTWNPSPQDPGCVSGYEIERASAAGGPYSPVATVPLDEKQTYNYNDTTATAGATWYYRIRSASDIGNSDPAEVSAARP